MTTLRPAPTISPGPSGAAANQSDRPLVWIDGQLLPRSQAKISVFDHGLLYGDGCFEGIRVYRGRIFKCKSHLDRIYRNAERLHMMRQNGGAFPYTPDQMRDVMYECIRANGLSDGYIRLLFTRGDGSLGLNPFKCPKPGVIVIADQISLYPPEMYRDGMRVVIAKRPKTPTPCLDPTLKSLNYLNNILAKVEAIDAGCLEAIMLSLDGHVGECTGDNLFIIKDGQAYTSPLDVGMLDGITRAFVMRELCPAAGVKCTEQRLTVKDVLSAQEVFLTGTAAEIIAVRQIDSTHISNGEGPVTAKLRTKFKEIVNGPHIPEN